MTQHGGCTSPNCIMTSPAAIVTSSLEVWQRANVPVTSFIICLIWLASVFGNSLVCVVIRRSRRLQSTTNYFVMSLALMDLSICIVFVPFILGDFIAGRWVFGLVICPMIHFFHRIATISTMYILSCICIDRFYTILYPLSFKVTRGGAKRMIVGSFASAILLSSPVLYFYRVRLSVYGPQCMSTTGDTWVGLTYISLLSVLTYFIPVLGMLSGHSRVFRYIWQAGTSGRAFQRTMNPVPRSKVKMVKLIIIVSLVVTLLLFPLTVMHIYNCTNTERYISSSLNAAVFIVSTLTTIVKPLMYLLLNPNFRRGCKEVFCMSALKCYRSNIYTVTTPSALAKQNHIGAVEDQMGNVMMQLRCTNSPSKTFDRATVLRKTAWPLNSDSSTNL